MSIKMALVGNPNCGKTTMFNAMTGANQYVGNWPGVTVEKKEGKLRGYSDVVVTDLPGIYSLSPYTLEEVVSRDYLINERPDAILNLVDATNLERNLYLTTQVLEMGIPVVVALNMMDLVRKNGDQISAVKLSEQLGCPVVEVSALKGTGLKELYAKAVEMAKAGTWQGCRHRFSGRVEEALEQIGGLIAGTVPQEQLCWYEVKLFERDKKVMEQLAGQELAGPLEEIVTACERELDDDSESIITNERYEYITSMLKGAYQKNRSGMTVSDRIDRIVTNRILALPIFVVVMGLVYAIAMGTSPAALFDGSGDPWGIGIGTFGTDWANDVLFGEIVPGWFDAVLGALNVMEGSVLYGLIQDGIVAGVGAVLGFVPQMLVLFLLLSVLEDCGYMARIAFIMDRIFRRFGLSGKSFIPMLVATGCGVPGIMASRTIEQDRDRKMTILLTPYMSCSAKLPIYGFFASTFFPGKAGLEHRVGGLEKDCVKGCISHDPSNHQKMVRTRAEKVAKAIDDIPAQAVWGAPEGDLLVVGWGGTRGHLQNAVDQMRAEGKRVSLCHFNYINPLPHGVREIFSKFRKIVVCELNEGQFANYLRQSLQEFRYEQYNKCEGLPFTVAELCQKFESLLK